MAKTKTETPAAEPTATPAEPTAPEAPVKGDRVLTHGPCGTTFQPGPDGIDFAKRTRTYFCGRCGGLQAAWTFSWADGSKLAE